ncbi:integrin alpha [Citrobacter sp. JGM124]|uniref:integrin alpha n=1 Tax=Citrobacter sp. JGM124 TaxID=2799789 RepID=UPI0020118BEB|nr:integrin alpha [Citrobacter sp. JGM124]
MKINRWFLLFSLLISMNGFSLINSRVTLKDGINQLDINGDGIVDLVIGSRFENNTSHPNNTMTIFIKNQQGKYYIVPVPNDLGFTWSDFILSASTVKISDYSLYKKKSGYFIISANKVTGGQYGDDMADALPVKFIRYDMSPYQDSPGVPPYSWEYTSAYTSTERYLDIDEAFKHFSIERLK